MCILISILIFRFLDLVYNYFDYLYLVKVHSTYVITYDIIDLLIDYIFYRVTLICMKIIPMSFFLRLI